MEAEELAALDAEVRVVAGTTARPMVSLSAPPTPLSLTLPLARSLARSCARARALSVVAYFMVVFTWYTLGIHFFSACFRTHTHTHTHTHTVVARTHTHTL
jgi:hypothetical protein